MPPRSQLNWDVPAGPWTVHEQAVLEEHGYKDLYAGVEAERIVRLWFRFEEDGASPRPGHTGTPLHTQKTNGSSVPLEDQEKMGVHVRFQSGLKERLTDAADQYDVYPGVMLAYILREYYETDGWGYAPEAVGSDPPPEPTSRRERLKVICDRLDTAENGDLIADDVREVIADVAGPTVVDGSNGYLSDVLDRIDYTHHPDTTALFVSEKNLRERHGLTVDDPAVARKPYSALTKEERIEGIKHRLDTTGRGMLVGQIHNEIFSGNGSKSYMGNLADAVDASDGYAFRTTLGKKKKVLRSLNPVDRDAESGSESELEKESEQEDETDDDRERLEDEADAQMDALMNAQPARTDGGQDEPEQ